MGCINSKKESSDLHPHAFHVVNIDEHGSDLCSGQLELTDNNIYLYREGRELTVWPLHSLRRYGFEEDIFSFESGRRCETGEGIYAFKCRRASALFRALQNQIQLRNVTHDSTSYPVSRMNSTPQGRRRMQATVVYRSSIDNGQADSLRPLANNGNISAIGATLGVERNANQAIRSPSSADILEVMPLYPHSQSSRNHASNVYQLRDFKREHNNNQGDPATDPAHVYSNDLNRDLAMLRNTLRQEGGMFQVRDDEDESFFLENRYANTHIASKPVKSTLSPTLSSTSEHYAQLSLGKQESARYYINIKLTDNSLQEMKRNDMICPATPPTPGGKQVEYSNICLGPKQEVNTYANLLLGEPGDSFKSCKQTFSIDCNQRHSDSDKFKSMSPVEELEVNYAVLDINKEIVKMSREILSPPSQSYGCPKPKNESHSMQRRSCLVSQSSLDNTTTSSDSEPTSKSGYTTIDFDKTVALTSVAADADVDSDGPRKLRHNSCVSGSPKIGDKHKNNY